MIALAFGTLGFWPGNGAGVTAAFTAAVAVSIIACLCTLGLTTPTALIVGAGGGAQPGILIEGPEVLEITRQVDTIVLDETGTVTTDKMTLLTVHTADGTDKDELRLAGAPEHSPEHPITQAVASGATARVGVLPTPADFTNIAGLGVQGIVEGHAVLVGLEELVAEWAIALHIELKRAKTEAEAEAEAAGRTAIAVACGDDARAALEVTDAVKETRPEAIKRLCALGGTPILLTGDNKAVAEAVAAEVGIAPST